MQVFPYGDVGGSVVFLVWRPRVTLFKIVSKCSHHQLGCSEHQTHSGGHKRCQTSRPLSGVLLRGKQHGALRDTKDRDPFEAGRVATPRPSDTPKTPPNLHTSHVHFKWEQSRQRNPRGAAACRTADGVSPLVQTGSERDPREAPGANTSPRMVTIGLVSYVDQTALGNVINTHTHTGRSSPGSLTLETCTS